MTRPLRFATYNIHGCRGWDGRRDVSRIAAVLEEIAADVIGLQEVESRPGRSAIDQAAALAEALGMSCIDGPILYAGGGWYGNALLSRLAVRGVRRVGFEPGGKEPRGAVVCELVADGGQSWWVTTTHLDVRSRARRRQFETLLRQVVDAPAAPTVVMGDFNEWWPFTLALRTLRGHAHLPSAQPTWPSLAPVFALDRIAFRRCRPVEPMRRHTTRLSRQASDHLPMVADLIADLDDPGSRAPRG